MTGFREILIPVSADEGESLVAFANRVLKEHDGRPFHVDVARQIQAMTVIELRLYAGVQP